MMTFEIRECSHPACGLRFPIDPTEHRGAFCPACGAPLKRVGEPFQNLSCAPFDGVQGRSIAVLLDNIRSAYNVGAIFRTADGVGVEHLYLCGITPTPAANTAVQKTALGAEVVTDWSYHPNAVRLAENLKGQGWQLIALECGPDAISIKDYPVNSLPDQHTVLILGNERSGVDPGLLDLCDAMIALPMAGEKASLNVAVAFGAAAYWLSFR